MALTIRLKRVGSNKKPVFRLVAMDQRNSAIKGRVEDLGTVDPRAKEPSASNLKTEKIQGLIRNGAYVTASAGQLLKKLGVDTKALPAAAK